MTIQLENVTKKFDKHVIFEDFSVNFNAGNIYALKGPSGSGKSTILNMIAKFDVEYSGNIKYNDNNIRQVKKKNYYKKDMGYLFQNYALLEEDTVYKNLKLGFTKKENKNNTRQIMIKALKAVNLDETYLYRHVYELSGGEQQRIAIARLYIKKPKIILIDEPTAALDDITSVDILNNVLTKMLSDNTVMIVASHDQIVFEWADVIIDVENISKL